MNTPLTIYTDYSEASHVITSPRLKEELATFRIDVLKGELKATWHPRLVKIPERKGWLVKKEKLEQLKSFLSSYNIPYNVSPLPSIVTPTFPNDSSMKEILQEDLALQATTSVTLQHLKQDFQEVRDLLSGLVHNLVDDERPLREPGLGIAPSSITDGSMNDATEEFKRVIEELPQPRIDLPSAEPGPLHYDIRDQVVIPYGGALVQETLPNGVSFPVVVLSSDHPVPSEYAKV